MDYWDILDEDRELTGKTVLRGTSMKHDEYHLVVDVWIKNSKGEYYITKKTTNKSFPNMWTITGGSAIAGDTSLLAALIEVEEEIGIALDPKNGKIVKSFRRDASNLKVFKDIWLFNEDIDEKKVFYQIDEVSDSKWATETTIRKMIKEGDFIPVMTYLDELFITK